SGERRGGEKGGAQWGAGVLKKKKKKGRAGGRRKGRGEWRGERPDGLGVQAQGGRTRGGRRWRRRARRGVEMVYGRSKAQGRCVALARDTSSLLPRGADRWPRLSHGHRPALSRPAPRFLAPPPLPHPQLLLPPPHPPLFFFSSRRRHTRLVSDWSSDVCSSD